MKRMLQTAMLALLTACGSSQPGQVGITLKFSPVISTATQDSIQQFLFLIGDASTTQKLLFPTQCLGCTSGTSPCPESDQCLETTDCGYARTSDTFQPEVNFGDIDEGTTLEIFACALDATQTPVSGGSGDVLNSDGASTTITMAADVTDCINGLPPLCP